MTMEAAADGFTVRTMTADEVALAIDWAAAEGWNPGHQDATLFRAVDPDGFLIGLSDGKPAAVISVVNYSAGFAFLGLYIANPKMRGRGFGWRTWQAGISHAGNRMIGLDGVVAEQDSYRESGFQLAYRNVRYSGAVAVPNGWQSTETLVPLAELPIGAIATLDAALFPVARPAFLGAWVSAPGHVGLGLMRDGTLVGFGVLRPCRIGFKLAPLIAPDKAAAEALFLGLAQAAGGAPIAIDVPEPNPEALTLVTDHGLRPVFETARMYTGPAPALPLDRLFGVMSFELG